MEKGAPHWPSMALPWIHPWADVAQKVNTNMRGHEYFIPTKFGEYPFSDSVVKADNVFPYIYMH